MSLMSGVGDSSSGFVRLVDLLKADPTLNQAKQRFHLHLQFITNYDLASQSPFESSIIVVFLVRS